MSKLLKVLLLLPVSGLIGIFTSCASGPACNNDACYDRNLSSSDPYQKGDIAAWGTEKEVAEEEAKRDRQMERQMHRTFGGERR
jgi:hypothetical protein